MQKNQTILKLCRSVVLGWACVLAAVNTQADPGTALRFEGTNSFVIIPHNATLNAFPLTITAWVKTLRNSAQVDGIVSKYQDGSFNGYAVHLYNGHLYGFILRSGGSLLPTSVGIDGGAIADGHWHHIAFVVGATTGYLYVDGNLRNSAPWTGTAGPPTSTEPFQIGRYHTYPNAFQGEIDEVTLWNRDLSQPELNYLKHRSLSGKEDGLVGYWRFDEGAGTLVSNTATNAYNGSFSNSPAWVPSHAAVVLQPIATNCLKFDGVNGYVQVASAPDLDSYPFSATAWFRTTSAANVFQGVVSKYVNASGNGWCIMVQNGLLRGFYYRQVTNRAIDVTYGIPVSDGLWHHTAMTVDASGGILWLDGVPVGSQTWVATPGGTTGVDPLLIGRFDTVAARFQGSIDEVTVWNRALTSGEIQTNRNLPLTGNEPGLVGYWRLDAGSGTTAIDSTAFGHAGSLISSPAWTGSTAYLGDGSVHLVAAPSIPGFSRTYDVNTAIGIIPILGKNYFLVTGSAFLRRFYDFGTAPASVALVTRLDGALQIAGPATPLAVLPNTVSNSFSLTAYNASTPQPLLFGSIASLSANINLQPAPGVQLDSVNNLHESVVTLSHSENGGGFVTDGTDVTTPAARLLHFNGHVMFGNVDIVVSNLLNTPVPGAVVTPSYIQTQLQIPANGAYFAAAPGVQFGGGAAFTVNLGVNGIATNVNGSFSFAGVNQFFEVNGIRYRMPGLSLNNNGLVATNFQAWLPTGFGVTTGTNSRAMLPYVTITNLTIGPNLQPTVSNITFTAASYLTNRLYFAEETKPFFIGASQIEWHIGQGEFYLAQADSVQFVRQTEDDDLNAFLGDPTFVNPIAADRISNDGYYHNLISTPGVPVYIRPDTNGAALLTMVATLRETEYRPHFPYMNRNIGDHIPVVGGTLIISNDVIDGLSHLLVAGPVPLPYARDCGADSCSSAPIIGAQVLNFTAPPGEFGLGQMNITPEGGLLAYGTIPPTNLTWGYMGGSDFAQRTSDVTTGAYYISGTFLRASDFTGEQDALRPVRLLFTGRGSSNDVNYVERPGQSNYADGFANYAGLNFRAPAQGRSVIAGTNSGLYPLTARSKYYVRFGGVNGIHEAASFPANLTLYGYPFTFLSYRLSFLDSDNRESRTDGAVALGGPAGFNVEFQRMTFLCRGNLDSAQLPATIGTKHMVYWNTDIQPLSLQFKPLTSDPCSFSTRFLVLGVETKLPFIPQALHATLGFKPNGNLVTDIPVVDGVNSRFAVPANLKLQGPGGSFFPLTAAGDAYFNNWETTGHPDAGFFSIVGRVRVPFFRDVKVQLHVTPTGPDTALLNLMGGWPAESGLGLDRGWNNGTQNYFNTSKFDPTHDGWPTAVALSNYRNSPDEKYRPRAQQNWIDVAGFDYPLAWNSVLRKFAGFADATVTLPVIDVNSRLKELSPGKVDFDFAQDLNVQLPHIKVLDLANDALNEINAPFNTLSNALRQELGSLFNTTGLTSGFRSLQGMMRENADGFFRPVLDQPISNVVETIYPALSNALAGGKANLLAQTPGIVTGSGNALATAIQNLNGTAAQSAQLLGQVNQTLNDADATLGLFLRTLEKDSSGKRHVIRVIIQKLAEDQGPGLGFVADLSDGIVNKLLDDLEPTLAQIESDLTNLRGQFNELRAQVASATGDFNSALNAANHEATSLNNYLQQAGAGVSDLLSAGVGPANDYFTANPQRAKQELRERLTITFLSSPIPGKYQQTFRQFLYDKNFLLDQLMDVLFDQINRSIRNGLENQIAGARDGIFQNLKGLGLLSQSLLSAKIRGAPTFEGDSLREIHLDSDIQMNLPDEMKFTAYMDIKELNSATTPIACIPDGGPSAEVTLGAKDVPLKWPGVESSGDGLKLSVEARWTLQSGVVRGIGGTIGIKGEGGFKGCNMSQIQAQLAIGSIENYFAGQGSAQVVVLGIPVDFHAGFFAGHACSLDTLKFVDPEVEQVIMQPGDFSGVYIEYGGGLPLSDIIPGLSDIIDVRADITTAIFYQGGPSFGRVGGREKMSVDITLFDVLNGHADWAVFAVLDTSGQLTVGGTANVCGRLGICPVCVKGCKGVTIKGVINTGGIDYFVDF